MEQIPGKILTKEDNRFSVSFRTFIIVRILHSCKMAILETRQRLARTREMTNRRLHVGPTATRSKIHRTKFQDHMRDSG